MLCPRLCLYKPTAPVSAGSGPVYGSLAKDRRQFFRTYYQFNTSTFILYLKETQKHFGKAAAIIDMAPPHRSKLTKKFLRANRSIRILYFLKRSPHLNAVKKCWH